MSDQLTAPCRSLPSEIIPDILSWLPVKSLCRFRCVSKSWLSLISDPQFVKMHFNKAIENEHVFYQRRRLLFTDEDSNAFYSFNLDEFLNHYKHHPFLNVIGNDNDFDVIGDDYDGDLVVTKLKLPSCVQDSEFKTDYWRLVSFCFGLVLFTFGRSEFYVGNPATRKYKRLPALPAELGVQLGMCNDGFGFDHSTDDFKVINSRSSNEGMYFIVYALKSGFWRLIQRRFPYKTDRPRSGFLLNGALHWLMRRHEDDSWVIVSFCLAEEEVREIPLPLDLGVGRWHSLELGLFYNDNLFIAHSFITVVVDGKNEIRNGEFWVMKEYGVVKSWTKRISSCGCGGGAMLPLVYWRENHALLWSLLSKRLGMYNFSDSRISSCQGLSIPGYPTVTGAGFYMESLVSLDDHLDFN